MPTSWTTKSTSDFKASSSTKANAAGFSVKYVKNKINFKAIKQKI